MRNRFTVPAAVVAAVLLAVTPALSVQAAASNTPIINGDFEADAVDSTTITGWTVLNERVNLGVTSIAGCVTTDTSDYDNLRGWDDEAEADVWIDWDNELVVPDKQWIYPAYDVEGGTRIVYGALELAYDDNDGYYVLIADDGTLTYDYDWDSTTVEWFETTFAADPIARADDLVTTLEEEEYAVSIVDGAALDRTGKVVSIYSDVEADENGYVVHGPAISSDVFSVSGARQVSLDWRAVADSDDFHIFGYLLNVDTCAQTEVLDATGDEQAWTTASVAIPAAGNYRFVFVAGTYDYSWGGAAGSYLYLDNIVQSKLLSGTDIDLDLQVAVGDEIAGAPAVITGGGLMPSSEYTLVLRSTPVTLYAGTTDASGNFTNIISMPTGITPGSHTLTLRGTAPDGSILTRVAYITIGADGRVTYVSYLGPAALANTGVEIAPVIATAAVLTLLGALLVTRSRRAARSA